MTMNIPVDLAAEFEEIAKRKLAIPQLSARKSDRLDFHEVYCELVADALYEAYKLGQQSATR